MDMEKLLAGLFAFQKFERNAALQSVIDEAAVAVFRQRSAFRLLGDKIRGLLRT